MNATTEFSVLIGVLIVEIVLSATWNRYYFTWGIPILIWRTPVKSSRPDCPDASELERHFESKMVASLLFREVGPNLYAFREELFARSFLHYAPIMHGTLLFDSDKGQVVVTGYSNWTALVFGVLWISNVTPFDEASIPLGILVVLVMAGMYVIQFYRFTNVGFYGASAWSELSPDNPGPAARQDTSQNKSC